MVTDFEPPFTRFIDYFSDEDNIFQKGSCPDTCVFKSLHKTPIVGIPEPQKHEFIGVLISEDPTTDFICRYLDAREAGKVDREKWRQPLFEKESPPVWLIERLEELNNKRWKGECTEEIKLLNDTIQNNFYWTHMLKCCTMKNKKLRAKPVEERITKAFTHHRGVVCAHNWLSGELSWAISHGAKCIITLGKSPEIWSLEWKKDAPDNEKVILINLPHPSPINRYSWTPESSDKLAKLNKDIGDLFKFCHDLD